MFRVTLIISLMVTSQGFAQTQEWWANNVNWDGQTHWSEYLIYSPRFTGPNAMPVPQISKGYVPDQSSIQIGGQYQARSGDQTTNLTFRASHTFLKNRVSVDLFMVPIEWFDLSHERKTERNVYFEHYSKNSAIGDLYVNTNIQVLNQDSSGLDLAIRIGLKTASSGLDNPARFIDSPGYYFDLSIGKSFKTGNLKIRPFGMIGFYAWQTNNESLRQNDALLYGLGYELTKAKWTFDQHLRGYSGYHDIDDKPFVFNSSFTYQISKTYLTLEYQHGLRDFLYRGFELRLGFNM
ncbi:MAG: hypothetical protein RJQ09_20420 [Cyclobacteriaceae bacterium]